MRFWDGTCRNCGEEYEDHGEPEGFCSYSCKYEFECCQADDKYDEGRVGL